MNVILYTKDACSYCTNAKLLLNSKGISYTEYKIGEDFTRETLLEMVLISVAMYNLKKS